jgi:hypothetical protein
MTVFNVVFAEKPESEEATEKKPKKAAKSLKVLDPKAGQNLCKKCHIKISTCHIAH